MIWTLAGSLASYVRLTTTHLSEGNTQESNVSLCLGTRSLFERDGGEERVEYLFRFPWSVRFNGTIHLSR